MYVGSCQIRDYRNFLFEELDFPCATVLITGPNSSGKTNLLEALSIAAFGTSRVLRLKRGLPLVRRGAESASLKMRLVHEDDVSADLSWAVTAAGERRILLDGKPLRRLSSLLARHPVVCWFEPDLEVFIGSPAGRRRYLDMLASKVDARYLALYAEWKECFNHKARLLAYSARGEDAARAELDALDVVFERRSRALQERRARLVERMRHVLDSQRGLYKGEEDFMLEYAPSMFTRGRRATAAEMDRGRPLDGPQRDELLFTLGGRELKLFASRGQLKNCLLRLKSVEYELTAERYGEAPVVLLDDPFAEMDGLRRGNLGVFMERCSQVFVSACDGNVAASCTPGGTVRFEIREDMVPHKVSRLVK